MIWKNGFGRAIFLVFIIYAIYSITNQQKLLNSYATEKNDYQNRLENAKEQNNELKDTLNNINSTNYIEEMARDKLDMYLPNERVYIDVDK